MSKLIELQNICVNFAQRKVLDNISLVLERGKITTLIGPNGAGKSTLVKVILGLQPVDSGSITKQPRTRIGYVPQKLKLNDSLPLNVFRFLRLAGKFSHQEMTEALEMVGAPHLASSNMHTLSGGESQRVLLARALLTHPDVLVLDEPAQGVDLQGQIDLYELIDRLRMRFNCAILMVSHDLHLVMAKTDHVICLQHHVCCSGKPQDVKNHPKYIAMFGHRTKEALVFYSHQHQHLHDLSGYPVEDNDAESGQCHNHGSHHD